ncbi:MAG: ImmA/IrrE family metallo-endopeptidase [Candidatus Baltobacteraceae bacterium]
MSRQKRTPKLAAQEILRKSGSPRLANGIAIDVQRIIEEHCGFEIHEIDGLDPGGYPVLGLFVPNYNIVMIEADCIEPRKRFSMAHELGHAELEYDFGDADSLFDLGEPKMFGCTSEDEDLHNMDERHAGYRRLKEILANKFAANLLMPEGLVRQIWREWRDAERVANALAVSREAIGYRLHELGLN